MNSYQRICFNILGERLKAKRDDFLFLRNDMMRARMTVPFEAYLASAYITSILVGLIFGVLTGFLTYVFRLPDLIVYYGHLPDIIVALNPFKALIGGIIVMIVCLIIFGGITYAIFLIYPGILAGERKRNIDATLPYAINYITAMSTAGITPAEVFRLLGQSKIYGESAVEARYIAREIDIFGKDLLDALRIAGQYTPSSRMREFFQGASASISAGSNLTEYFRAKSEQYTRPKQRRK